MLYHLRHRSEVINLDAREARGRDVVSDRNNEGEKELAMTIEMYKSHQKGWRRKDGGAMAECRVGDRIFC